MNIKAIITETLEKPDKNYVQTAVNRILGEDVSVGDSVAVIDDPIYGLSGSKGKVRSISSTNPGFATVALENGTSVNMQTSLLIPIR